MPDQTPSPGKWATVLLLLGAVGSGISWTILHPEDIKRFWDTFYGQTQSPPSPDKKRTVENLGDITSSPDGTTAHGFSQSPSRPRNKSNVASVSDTTNASEEVSVEILGSTFPKSCHALVTKVPNLLEDTASHNILYEPYSYQDLDGFLRFQCNEGLSGNITTLSVRFVIEARPFVTKTSAITESPEIHSQCESMANRILEALKVRYNLNAVSQETNSYSENVQPTKNNGCRQNTTCTANERGYTTAWSWLSAPAFRATLHESVQVTGSRMPAQYSYGDDIDLTTQIRRCQFDVFRLL